MSRVSCTCALLACLWSAAQGASYPLPPDGESVVGGLQHVKAWHEDTLLDVARRHSLGFEEILLANPGVDPWLPGAGTPVLLPTRYVLPDAPREGIVLNLAEMRLYYYPEPRPGEPGQVITYPVSIGRGDWETPLGLTHILMKVANPTWHPPASIREEHAKEGDPLPEKVPPGPDNPLGEFALRLALPGYLIHGTNKPYGIGMRVSHGCVRLYPEDISLLFERVATGTQVRIVNQPYKTGWSQDALMLEAHPPEGERSEDSPQDLTPLTRALVAATETRPQYVMDWKFAEQVALDPRGIPLAVAFTRPVQNRPIPGARMGLPPHRVNGADETGSVEANAHGRLSASFSLGYRPEGIPLKIAGWLSKLTTVYDPAWPEGWTSLPGLHDSPSAADSERFAATMSRGKNGVLRISRTIYEPVHTLNGHTPSTTPAAPDGVPDSHTRRVLTDLF